MRMTMFALSVLLLASGMSPAFGLADDWTPPKNPDPSAILQEAKADAGRGDHELALAKQLWYHANAVKLQPGQTGVRLSFALNQWLELGEVFPPALDKMRQVRDATEQKIRDEERVRVRFEDFHDFVALNRTLRQEERTVKTFHWLHETDPEDAKRVFDIAKPALIKQKEYELCGMYIDPQQDVRRIGESYTQGLSMVKRFGERHQEFVEKKLVNDATTLVAILVQNNRSPEAKEAAEALKGLVSDARLSTKLQNALESALTGTVPTPWP